MNAKNAKKAFSFNIFLASIASEPLEIKYTEIADVLGVSESTLSKLRHGRMKKMPASLHPGLMASRFAAEVVKGFEPTHSTVKRFSLYAKMLNDRYILSDSFARFVTLFHVGEPVDEERAKKFYTGMIPELIKRCYEEAYSVTEQEYANWLMTHGNEQSEVIYRKICDTIDEDMLDTERLKQLLNVVYAASLRRQLSNYFSDISFLEMLGGFIRSQVNQPFYLSVRRSEQISISENSKELTRIVQAEEQIVAQSLSPVEFTLTQIFYHAMGLPVEEIVKCAFNGLSCTINKQPLVRYINSHENSNYVSSLQFVTAAEMIDEVDSLSTTRLVFKFNLYPTDAGEPICVAYEYSSTSPFIQNVSCNYSYTLHYPCKSLEHEFLLDAATRKNWGMRVKLFTSLTNSTYSVKDGGVTGSKHVMFYDWALPGTGYYRNLYTLQQSGK